MKIAISGFAGSGKNAVAVELEKQLKKKYKDIKLIIPTFKDLAKKQGISLMEFQELAKKDKKIDIKFDNYIKSEAKLNKNWITSTWLACWVVNADLKIFLYANEFERAKRISKRDKMTFKEALKHVKKRDIQNIKRYKKVYGYDISSPENIVDLIINSGKFTVKEEVEIILSALKSKKIY